MLGAAHSSWIWLLAAVSLLPWLLNLIPNTSLAAILVFTGFKLVSPQASRLKLRGAATFVRLPKLAAALEAVPGSMHLQIVLDKLDYIDHACIDLLSNWEKQHQAGGGQITMEWDKLHRKYHQRTGRTLAVSRLASA